MNFSKSLFIAGIIFVISPPNFVLANDSCRTWSSLATSIMSVRQKEMPMFDLMDLMKKTIPDPTLQDVIKKIILAAYEEPSFRSENNQERAIKEFSNEMAMACIKELEKG